MIVLGILFFLSIASLLLPFLAKSGAITLEMLPFYFYEQILLKNDLYLNSLFFFFLSSLAGMVLLISANQKLNQSINRFLTKALPSNNQVFYRAYPLELFTLCLTIIWTLIFWIFFSHTAFEWPTSGEIPVIMRSLDSGYLIQDFYTNAASSSPKLIFAKFVTLFEVLGVDWYAALYILKCLSVIVSPPLLFVVYVKILEHWQPDGLKYN